MKTTKGNKKITATALAITVIKSSSFVTLPQAFKRRSTTTKPRLVSYTVNGISARAKVKHFVDTTKLLALINDFRIDNAQEFIEAIGKCFPQQVEKESKNSDVVFKSKYQLLDFSEFGVKILFRISDHNINCANIKDDIEEAYSIALKSKKTPNTFRATDVTATEYVFFEENNNRHRYRLIARALLALLETGEWNERIAPADAVNHSPRIDGLNGGNEKTAGVKTCGIYGIEITIKKKDVERSPHLVQNEHGQMLRAFSMRQRSECSPTRWLNHLSGVKVENLSQSKKRINKKIKEWERGGSLSVADFFLFIALELRMRASQKNGRHYSYYVSVIEKKDRFVLRISDHHFDARTGMHDDAAHTTSLTFPAEETEDWDVFKAQEKVHATEYVYYEKNLKKSDIIMITKDIATFIETGEYTPSVKPDEINHSPIEGLNGGDVIDERETMRAAFNQLVRELGEKKGRETFEWYCQTYGVTMADPMPATVKYEVFGVTEPFAEIERRKRDAFGFSKHLANELLAGRAFDWKQAKAYGKDYHFENDTEFMQACETAVVLAARDIAQSEGMSVAQRYAELKDLYERQVTIRPLDTKSKILQQYSTPCPLAFLLGQYVQDTPSIKGFFLEPSAGNGMLTIGLGVSRPIWANEIDEVRYKNLRRQFENDFRSLVKVSNIDASIHGALATFGAAGVITNPPFKRLEPNEQIKRNGWPIETLDYKMTVLALDAMHDDGRAAIIVGGKLWGDYWKRQSANSENRVLYGGWKYFLGYLYAQYNVEDVIYINGEYIYRKQGTTYPIVVILINGRHTYDENVRPNYVFDPERDVIIDTFDQLYERMMRHLAGKTSAADERKRLRLQMELVKVKIAIAKAKLKLGMQ